MQYIEDLETARTLILTKLGTNGLMLTKLARPHIKIMPSVRDAVLSALVKEGKVKITKVSRTGRLVQGVETKSTSAPKPPVKTKASGWKGRQNGYIVPSPQPKPSAETVQIQGKHFAPDQVGVLTFPFEQGIYLLTIGADGMTVAPLRPTADPARYQHLEEENKRLQGLVEAYESKQKSIEATWGALTGLLDNKSLVQQ